MVMRLTWSQLKLYIWLPELVEKLSKKSSAKPRKKGQATATSSTPAAPSDAATAASSSPAKLTLSPAKSKKETKVEKKPVGDVDDSDNLFQQFCELCHCIEKEPSYNAKTKLVANYIKHGASGGEQDRHMQYMYFDRQAYDVQSVVCYTGGFQLL